MNKKEDIKKLNIDKKIIQKLNEININKIEDLWKLKKSELKSKGISDSEINHISIKLQLVGLDFNKKIYKYK